MCYSDNMSLRTRETLSSFSWNKPAAEVRGRGKIPRGMQCSEYPGRYVERRPKGKDEERNGQPAICKWIASQEVQSENEGSRM